MSCWSSLSFWCSFKVSGAHHESPSWKSFLFAQITVSTHGFYDLVAGSQHLGLCDEQKVELAPLWLRVDVAGWPKESPPTVPSSYLLVLCYLHILTLTPSLVLWLTYWFSKKIGLNLTKKFSVTQGRSIATKRDHYASVSSLSLSWQRPAKNAMWPGASLQKKPLWKS